MMKENDVICGRLSEENFTLASLDGFISRQEVSACWRKRDGQWVLLPIAYTDDCAPAASAVLEALRAGSSAFGAWTDGQLAGFAILDRERFGSRAQYVGLAELHVSQPLRGRGIGRALFRLTCREARALGAERLYISAHSAQETIAAYRAFGCVEAEEINWTLAKKEPCDVQLEYVLESGGAGDIG